jgi:hypothetical protein
MTFFSSLKIVEEAEKQTPGYLQKSLLITIYRVYFSHNYGMENSAVQAYIYHFYILM